MTTDERDALYLFLRAQFEFMDGANRAEASAHTRAYAQLLIREQENDRKLARMEQGQRDLQTAWERYQERDATEREIRQQATDQRFRGIAWRQGLLVLCQALELLLVLILVAQAWQ